MHAANFENIMHLLLKGASSGILVQVITKRWWDTTNTFHVAKREMTVTSHDFHRMTSLRSNGPIIDLEGESGIQLGIDLLGCRYSSERIHYFDLETNYKPLSKATPDDCAQMVKVFLHFLLRAYLFANGRKMVSLR